MPMIRFLVFGLLAFLMGCSPAPIDPEKEEWVSLFNGSNLHEWTPKFKGYALGEDYQNVFRLNDSLLSVQYAEKDSFSGSFGHLFYRDRFSHYRLKAVYRFVGEQMSGGPGWAFRNNGLMLHSQDPRKMGQHQDFPISLEVQLLGGNGTDERPTANLCTPGTNVVMNDTLFTPHCVNSTSGTYHGDQWVEVEVLVLGDSLIRHIINDEVVMEYKNPTIGGGDISGYREEVYQEGVALKEGYIAIQSETHPTDFKSIELLNLCGCMDPKAKNYKSYYVQEDNESCVY